MKLCEKCWLRKKYDNHPNSLLGRLWRWHITFCPGWKRFYRNLSAEKQAEMARHYHLK